MASDDEVFLGMGDLYVSQVGVSPEPVQPDAVEVDHGLAAGLDALLQRGLDPPQVLRVEAGEFEERLGFEHVVVGVDGVGDPQADRAARPAEDDTGQVRLANADERFRLGLGQAWMVIFEDVTNARMQLLSSAAQQRLVCSFLDQGVLKNVRSVGQYTSLVYQPCLDELRECGVQILLR